MNFFFPFIYNNKPKKKFEQDPIYAELYPPPLKKIEKEEEKEESRVIIIEL